MEEEGWSCPSLRVTEGSVPVVPGSVANSQQYEGTGDGSEEAKTPGGEAHGTNFPQMPCYLLPTPSILKFSRAIIIGSHLLLTLREEDILSTQMTHRNPCQRVRAGRRWKLGCLPDSHDSVMTQDMRMLPTAKPWYGTPSSSAYH